MKLVTTEHCPFCLRCILALLEKDLSFETCEIDLRSKTAPLELLSPYRRVPVLVDTTATVFESSIINEYLEESYPTPPLLPNDPSARARARFWIDFCNTRFMPAYFNLLKAQEPGERGIWRTRLMNHLTTIDKEGLAEVTDNSPYWMGGELTLVDIAFYPFFERFAAVEVYRDVSIPLELTRLRIWLAAIAERPSVRKITRPRQHHIDYYREFYAD